ncbi:MAG: cytochrome c biogenesis protein CcdA [Proteobacteria bacterium]|nr:cytochrome c biogenesis protein CcdA [Pseudomonadota bacterium]MBI3498570.1 cytochrome c biogenesis protein CcdA [Pseudomonadota bacterium]
MIDLSAVGLATAFFAGTVSFLSPCVLPLVPGYLSFIAGRPLSGPSPEERTRSRLPVLGLSLCFVLGFSTVFVLFGASATAIGHLLLRHRYETNLIGGVIVILFGIAMTGALRLQWLQREWRLGENLGGGTPIAAFVLGLAFAFGWTPCIGPVLGAILTVSATTATVQQGIILLAIYSLGLGLPFLVAAACTDTVATRLRPLRRLGRSLQVLAGGVMVVMGIAMITGTMSTFAYWLLETIPGFASIG